MDNLRRSGNNLEKMNYLLMVLNENKKDYPLYYTISLVRFGSKLPVICREPASTNIKAQIEKYASASTFNPDQIVVELYTARSRNVTKPFAVYRFDYKART